MLRRLLFLTWMLRPWSYILSYSSFTSFVLSTIKITVPHILHFRHSAVILASSKTLPGFFCQLQVILANHVKFFIIEFLAYVEQTPLAASTEYDLRTFLYDWFPRKVRIPPDEAPGLLVALKRWFAHLARERGIEFPWAAAILADRDGFDERVRTFPGGFFWDEAVQVWQAAASADLDARLLLHDRRLGDAEQWGDTMGPVEYGLRHELQRRWLIWRDEVVRSGTTGPADVRAALVRRQREWEAAPHPEHGGWTVVEVVAEERKRHGSPGPVVHRRQRRKPHRRG